MRVKIGLIAIIAITAMAFTACNRGASQSTASNEAQTHIADTEEGFTAGIDPYEQSSLAKFLAGDMSDFAGTWVNGYGWKARLSSAGVFVIETLGGANLTAYGFEKTGDSANETYSWYVSSGGESMGNYFTLFPAGTEVMDNSYPPHLIATDTTKVRIADTAKNIGSSAEVYYREGELPTQTAANIPSDIAEIIHKRVEAIENGDIAAFRATLAPYEDNSDYNFQFRILATFFGDLFGINADAAIEALANGDDVSEYVRFLFHGVHRPVSRNTGLRITNIERNEAYGYNATVVDNRMQENIISFMFSSF